MKKNNVATAAPVKMNVAATNHIGSSMIRLSCTKDVSFNGGDVVPVHSFPVVPGDVVSLTAEEVVRQISPSLHPTFDDLHVDMRVFYVPDRLVFPRIAEMFGENKTGIFDITTGVKPRTPKHAIATGNVIPNVNCLGHYYYGVAHPTATLPLLSSKKTRGYVLIWNEWYRDQNTQAELLTTFDDANDTNSTRAYSLTAPLQKANRVHDAFTSASPKPQKGEATILNLGGIAPVFAGSFHGIRDGQTPIMFNASSDGGNVSSFDHLIGFQGTASAGRNLGASYDVPSGISPRNNISIGNLWANLSTASGLNVNDLRMQFAYQRILEKNARFGTRWREYLMAHHGVFFDEYLVQVPKYLGGSTYILDTYQVPNTTGENQGQLASYTYKHDGKHHVAKFSVIEYGRIHVLMTVRKRTTYQQALDYDDFEDDETTYYNPEFAHLGEQAILNPAIFAYTNNRQGIFGYQEPWWYLRMWLNRTLGDFNSASPISLDTYHYGDFFTDTPTLIGLLPDNTRQMLDRTLLFDSTNCHQFGFNIRIIGFLQRNMPLYSIPGNIDQGYTGRF